MQGFKQVEGQHYDASSISAPVTNGMTIKLLVLALILESGGIGIVHVVDVKVKGAYLDGEFANGEKIYSPSAKMSLRTQAGGNCFLQEASCCNKQHRIQMQLSRSMPLLQMGREES